MITFDQVQVDAKFVCFFDLEYFNSGYMKVCFEISVPQQNYSCLDSKSLSFIEPLQNNRV